MNYTQELLRTAQMIYASYQGKEKYREYFNDDTMAKWAISSAEALLDRPEFKELFEEERGECKHGFKGSICLSAILTHLSLNKLKANSAELLKN
jgi:hypothetical protein